MPAGALAATERVANEPENEEHDSEKPQDVYSKAEAGYEKDKQE
jgi:hypothetical protein